MIEPVAAGHIISRTSDGIVVFMNMALFSPLFPEKDSMTFVRIPGESWDGDSS